MIKRFKDWLYRKYLPAYAKESVWQENAALKQKLVELEAQRKIDIAEAYARGMEYAVKHNKVTIRNEVKQA